jgi:type II secretory pathway pseudopilin PulG
MGRLVTRLLRNETGTTLIELLVVSSLLVVIVGATMAFLEFGTRTQQRDQAFGQEITATQAALARLSHDLRQATRIVAASPNSVEFYLPAPASVTYDVRYDCTQADTLGTGYNRCARLQSTYPAALPIPSATPGSLDIQHVQNGGIVTYCKVDGSATSGSVFYFQDPNNADTNPSPPACDETYQLTVAGTNPPYVQVTAKVPASGDQVKGGLTHSTELTTGAFIQNRGYGL